MVDYMQFDAYRLVALKVYLSVSGNFDGLIADK